MPPYYLYKGGLFMENDEVMIIKFKDEDSWMVHGFTQVPNCIALCPDLTIQARHLYTVLCVHAMHKEKCFPSQQTLCDEMGIKKPKNIYPYLKELNEGGLINIIRRTGTSNIYEITCIEAYKTPVINNYLAHKLNRKYDTTFTEQAEGIHSTGYKNRIPSVGGDPSQRGTPCKVDTSPVQGGEIHLAGGTNNKKGKIKKEEEKESPSLFNLNNCNTVNAVIDYLNVKAGTHFKPTTRSYVKEITGRLKEGYKLDNFKYVIDVKVAEWKDDKKMRQYLNPETLFRVSNFDRYLNQLMPAKQVSKTQEMEGIDYDDLNRLHKIQETSKKSDVIF